MKKFKELYEKICNFFSLKEPLQFKPFKNKGYQNLFFFAFKSSKLYAKTTCKKP